MRRFHPVPARFPRRSSCTDDVAAAIRFVKAHAAEYRMDPDRIALIGESAGGHLGALVSLAKNSGMMPQWIRQSIEGSPWEAMILTRLKQLSPIEQVQAGMPPFLLIYGTRDQLVPFEESRAMCDRIKSVGGVCELYPVRGAGHGIRWWDAAASASYQREMLRWLSLQL